MDAGSCSAGLPADIWRQELVHIIEPWAYVLLRLSMASKWFKALYFSSCKHLDLWVPESLQKPSSERKKKKDALPPLELALMEGDEPPSNEITLTNYLRPPPAWPANLTWLHISYDWKMTYTDFEGLPAGLLHLKIESDRIRDPRIMAVLPRGLQTLDLNDWACIDLSRATLAALPPGLKNLYHLTNETLNNVAVGFLPKGLTSLDIGFNNALGPFGIAHLPRGLTYLNISCNNQIGDGDVANLPRGLLHLVLAENDTLTNAGLVDLPPGLRNLDMNDNTTITDLGIALLPRSLTHLSMNENDNLTDAAMASLPVGLKHLYLAMSTGVTDAGIAALPRGLESLYMWCHVTAAFAPLLPRTLTCIGIFWPELSAKDMAKLPPGIMHVAGIMHEAKHVSEAECE